MADWSSLPDDLLHLISQHLPTSIDRLRFRSVCPTWRAAAPPPPPAAARFSIAGGSHILIRRVVYLLQLPLPEYSSRIIKLDWACPTRTQLIDPILGSKLKYFPEAFSFLNIRVRELGEEYEVRSRRKWPRVVFAKVAVLNDGRGGFVVVGIDKVGNLRVLKSGDDKWRFVDYSPRPYHVLPVYIDLVLWGGRFYAVESIGLVVLVNTDDFNVHVLAHVNLGGPKLDKYFMGSEEGLLFLNWYRGRIKVLRVRTDNQRWTNVIDDLGDKILFVSRNCSFLASAAEIFGNGKCRGTYLLERPWRCKGTYTIWAIKSARRSSIDISLQMLFEKIFRPPPSGLIETTPNKGSGPTRRPKRRKRRPAKLNVLN